MKAKLTHGWSIGTTITCILFIVVFVWSSPGLASAHSLTAQKEHQGTTQASSGPKEIQISTARAKQLALRFSGPNAVAHMLYRMTPMQPQPNVHVKFATSSNWSGYYADTTGKGQSVIAAQAHFPVPNESTSSTLTGTWAGIGGVHGGNLAQTGVARGGGLSSSWYEFLPANPVYLYHVNATDSMLANVSLDEDNGLWYIDIQDFTTNQYYANEFSYNPNQATADWIIEVPSGAGSVPSFGTVHFTQSFWADNHGHLFQKINSSEDAAVAVTLVDPQGGRICPSGLGSDGESFSLARC